MILGLFACKIRWLAHDWFINNEKSGPVPESMHRPVSIWACAELWNSPFKITCNKLSKLYAKQTCPKTSSLTPSDTRNFLVSVTTCVSPRAMRTARLLDEASSKMLPFVVLYCSAMTSATAFTPRNSVFQLWPWLLRLFFFASRFDLKDVTVPDRKKEFAICKKNSLISCSHRERTQQIWQQILDRRYSYICKLLGLTHATKALQTLLKASSFKEW